MEIPKIRDEIRQHGRDGALTADLLGLCVQRSWFVAKVEERKRERGQSECEPSDQPTDMVDMDRLGGSLFVSREMNENERRPGGW